MVDPRLVAYIRQQRQVGSSDVQIAAVLKAQGYPGSLIQAAMKEAAAPGDARLLAGYARAYLAQGYTPQQVMDGLLQQGYNPADVQRALTVAQAAPQHHGSAALLLIPLLAVAVIVGGFLLLRGGGEELAVIPSQPLQNVRLGDILQNLQPMARSNPDMAISLCDTVVEKDRQRCLLVVGQESGNPRYCEGIEEDWSRDSCYLHYIYVGRYEYCDRLRIRSNIDYCERVKSVALYEAPGA